ncbi:MAG: F0F1 ATP synthase subunit delta [Terrimicrobiaceae bacterium]|nr:F0F1 ATP synthase subunit delta [Terrimicrobiaceae bacterium]
MKLSRETRRQARELFDLALVNGRIDENRLREIVDGIVNSKPRSYLALLKELTRLVRLEAEKHHAIVESASPLDADETNKLASSLRARFGEITTEFRSNPALIGGVRIKIGSDVWDNSVAARLHALEQQL